MTTSLGALRDRFNSFVADHEVAWELVMAALAAAYVSVGFAGDQEPSSQAGALAAADTMLTAIFVLEFVSRFTASRDRLGYLRGHWIDGGGEANVDARVAGLRRLDEWLGWVHRGDIGVAHAPKQLGGQGAGAATDLDHSLSRGHAREIRHLWRQQGRVASHEPVIGLGGDIEAHDAVVGPLAGCHTISNASRASSKCTATAVNSWLSM